MNSSSSKSSLFLMELIFSILFFLLASVVCVQMFVRSHTLSQESVRLNHAVIWCESLAESFYACDGDMDRLSTILEGAVYDREEDTVYLYYDNGYAPCDNENESKRYRLLGKMEKEGELLVLNISLWDMTENVEVYSISPKLFPANSHTK